MRPAGLAAVEAAKADGRWECAYGGPATVVEPKDFKTALDAEHRAATYWRTLNKGQKFTVLHKIELTSQNARANRIDAVVAMLGTGHYSAVASRAATRKAMLQRQRNKSSGS